MGLNYAQTPLTDDEFIELYRAVDGNIYELARRTGMQTRRCKARRRVIEQRYNIRLETKDIRGSYYKHLSPTEHTRVRKLEVQDGVVLVMSDAHFWPDVRTTAFRAFLHFIEELKPKAIICNGDAFDGASISRFPRIGWDSTPSVIQELKACTERLGEIEEIAESARLVWPLGNHDARFESRLAAAAPQYEHVKGFSLRDHFPKWEPCWALEINNDCVVKHRWKGGIYATRNNTLNSGKTMVTGHLHSLKVSPLTDYNGTRWGVDTGTLADPNGPQFSDYTECSPKDWRSGFVVLTWWKGQLLTPEVVSVLDYSHVDFRGHAIEIPE